jgi:hypothetical protein
MFYNFHKIFLPAFFCLCCLIFCCNFFSANQPEQLSIGANPVYASTSQDLLTSVKILLVCGDGFVDPYYEVCDPGNSLKRILSNTGTTTCQSFIDEYTGLPFASGRLACLSDCSAISTSTCYTCGDNHRQEAEECDGTDFGSGNDCASYGYTTGTLTCTSDCRLDLSDCSVVGTKEPTEGSTATTGGGGGGSSGRTTGYRNGTNTAPDKTLVVINGIAYPNREVRVLVDSTVIGIVRADSRGNFHFESGDTTAGISSYSLWTDDATGLKSTLLTLTFRVASKSVTTIDNVYLSPTINVDKTQVNKGDPIKIYGVSSPSVNISVHVNSDVEKVSTTTSGSLGDWSLVFDTSPLEEAFHTVKAMVSFSSSTGIIESNYSRSVSFYVGKNVAEAGKCEKGDLNCDNSINLVDFSILLYNWGTTDTTADINSDGKVGLADFSIMMYHWTG